MHFVETKGILSSINGLNLYRGCSHGCIYCDSRSKCYQFTHEFTDIEVKSNAIELLENSLKKKKNKIMISTGSMCDPYIHEEKKLEMTKKMLEVIRKYNDGVIILTKSNLVLRDLELIKEINSKAKAVVSFTITTYDDNLCRIIEPFVSVTSKRFEALKIFKDNGIDIGIWLCPLLPFINDSKTNLINILNKAKEIGVKYIINFGMGLTLREGNREYFYSKLDEFFPGLKERYINMYSNRYEISVPNHQELEKIFYDFCKMNNIMYNIDEIFKYLRTYESKKC